MSHPDLASVPPSQHTEPLGFIVTDRPTIERGILVKSAYVVISIRDPRRRKASIARQSGLRDVLYLAFHDAEPTAQTRLPDGMVLMSRHQAREIWAFVRKWSGEVGAVVVHCEQGMSRSPAVAAALCKGLGGDDARFFKEYQPNHYVYRLMLRGRDAVSGQ